MRSKSPPSPTATTIFNDAATRDNNLAMGNPSGAVADATNSPNNYLMAKTQYTMSYSRDKGKPNWVSWHLSSAWLGSTARQDNFAVDASLPSTWYHVGSTSYSSSGFDRGHNCPSADRTSVDAIEGATGYDILSTISASVQSVVEAQVDNGPTQLSRSRCC